MSPEARCRTCFSLENIHLRNPLNPKIKPIVHTSLSYSAGVIGPTEMDRLGIASVPCATQTFIIPTMCVKETARVRPERNAAHDEGKHRQLIHHFHCYRSPTHSRGETEKPKHISNEVPPSLTLVSPPPPPHTPLTYPCHLARTESPRIPFVGLWAKTGVRHSAGHPQHLSKGPYAL